MKKAPLYKPSVGPITVLFRNRTHKDKGKEKNKYRCRKSRTGQRKGDFSV